MSARVWVTVASFTLHVLAITFRIHKRKKNKHAKEDSFVNGTK